jgi:1-aminocyclopropane-1-carboxylate deaminase
LIKREDLNHPHISGNKWWKLKYNLEEAIQQKKKTLLTFGGAYSNHIYATAAAAHEFGFQSIGIIRGEEALPLNRTLSFAKECGMSLHYVSREKYKGKTDLFFLEELKNQFGDYYLIPEGGTNDNAIRGAQEFGESLKGIYFDYLCVPVGTGGTMSGLIESFKGERELVGFPVLRNGTFLNDEISQWLSKKYTNWHLETEYHFGGYAKASPRLLDFIKGFELNHNILLDPVYTGKMRYGIFDMLRNQKFKKGSIILAIHTGGLHGRDGFNL